MTVLEQASVAAAANPVSGASKTLHSLPLLRLDGGREQILAYFENTWALTEMLFSGLASEAAFFQRPYHKTRHPLVFYYAHPVCFYVNKLMVSGLIPDPVNQEFELLFEVGVDEMNWDDLHEGDRDRWPPLAEVREYRHQVYELVHELIRTHPILDEPVTMDRPSWALVMAFEHERIHLETSSVLMRELPIDMVREPDGWPAMQDESGELEYSPQPGRDFPPNSLVKISRSTQRLGKPRDWPSFGWDNEYGNETREVPRFRAGKFLVSNGEFFQFVAAGGYETRQYWSEQGWGWRTFRNVKWPTFWVQDGPAGSHRYKLRTIFREIEMQWRWPAVVNY
ncbi:MAG: 5-histidylcysteine sulfoxide synthase, partial [Gammaproteobacteria bacterium]